MAQRTWSQILRLLAAKIIPPQVLSLASIGHIINKPIAGEIWHLSIEDLFAQPENLSLGGSGPFVINLSVSTAPISETARLTCAEPGAQVYQIKVFEDGRTRYRLRLGPFAHEREADAALFAVRDDYPGALTATAGPADLQIFESRQAALDKAVAKKESVLAEPEPPALDTIPVLEVEVEFELKPSAPAVAAIVTAPVVPPPQATLPPPQPVAVRPAERVAAVDSTQTVRALTPTELNDRTASPSFVVQLLLAEQPPDPEAVPNLDIFTEYRLYAVAGRDQGVVKHALRLGFFADEAAAKMVASYLAAYYDNPCVVRVSGAEKERFAERRVEARKDVGATGRHAAIEITGDLVARRRISTPA